MLIKKHAIKVKQNNKKNHIIKDRKFILCFFAISNYYLSHILSRMGTLDKRHQILDQIDRK